MEGPWAINKRGQIKSQQTTVNTAITWPTRDPN